MNQIKCKRCERCNGTGEISELGFHETCPDCNGDGVL